MSKESTAIANQLRWLEREGAYLDEQRAMIEDDHKKSWYEVRLRQFIRDLSEQYKRDGIIADYRLNPFKITRKEKTDDRIRL